MYHCTPRSMDFGPSVRDWYNPMLRRILIPGKGETDWRIPQNAEVPNLCDHPPELIVGKAAKITGGGHLCRRVVSKNLKEWSKTEPKKERKLTIRQMRSAPSYRIFSTGGRGRRIEMTEAHPWRSPRDNMIFRAIEEDEEEALKWWLPIMSWIIIHRVLQWDILKLHNRQP